MEPVGQRRGFGRCIGLENNIVAKTKAYIECGVLARGSRRAGGESEEHRGGGPSAKRPRAPVERPDLPFVELRAAVRARPRHGEPLASALLSGCRHSYGYLCYMMCSLSGCRTTLLDTLHGFISVRPSLDVADSDPRRLDQHERRLFELQDIDCVHYLAFGRGTNMCHVPFVADSPACFLESLPLPVLNRRGCCLFEFWLRFPPPHGYILVSTV